jgi:hypothetical protein
VISRGKNVHVALVLLVASACYEKSPRATVHIAMSFPSPLRLESTQYLSPIFRVHCWRLIDDFALELPEGCVDVPEWQRLGLDVGQISRDGSMWVHIVVRAGFETDLGTTPRVFWWFASPVDVAYAAVIHDKMYNLLESTRRTFWEKRRLRRDADRVFLMGLHAQPGSSWMRSWSCWLAVRAFGWMLVNSPFRSVTSHIALTPSARLDR